MLMPAHRTITQHSTPSGVTAQNPLAPSVEDGRMALTDGAISYAKAGTGPAVLLIHGPGGTRHTWRHLIPVSGGGLGAVVTPILRAARTVTDWHGRTVSISRQLGQLSEVPLLVAWGADDKTIPPPHRQALADRVCHAVTVDIADAGHYPHETAPAQLLSALQTLLAATRPFRYVEERWVQLLTSTAPAGTINAVGMH